VNIFFQLYVNFCLLFEKRLINKEILQKEDVIKRIKTQQFISDRKKLYDIASSSSLSSEGNPIKGI